MKNIYDFSFGFSSIWRQINRLDLMWTWIRSSRISARTGPMRTELRSDGTEFHRSGRAVGVNDGEAPRRKVVLYDCHPRLRWRCRRSGDEGKAGREEDRCLVERAVIAMADACPPDRKGKKKGNPGAQLISLTHVPYLDSAISFPSLSSGDRFILGSGRRQVPKNLICGSLDFCSFIICFV